MPLFKKSDDDASGLIPYSLGVTVVVITLASVAGANMLSVVAQQGNGPVLALFGPKASGNTGAANRPRQPAEVDYGATGSIGAAGGPDNFLAHPIVLDPCTGRQK